MWLPVWAGYLIVATVVLIIAAVLALLGKKALDKAQPSPDRAIDQAQQTIAVLKSPLGEPTVTTPPTTGATSAAPARHPRTALRRRARAVRRTRPRQPDAHAPVETASSASTPRCSTGATSSRVRA